MKLKTLVNALWYEVDLINIYLGTPENPEFLSGLDVKKALAVYGDMKVKRFHVWDQEITLRCILDIIL